MICKRCKSNTTGGGLCNSCKLELARQLKSSIDNTSSPTLKDLKSHPMMYRASYRNKT